MRLRGGAHLRAVLELVLVQVLVARGRTVVFIFFFGMGWGVGVHRMFFPGLSETIKFATRHARSR